MTVKIDGSGLSPARNIDIAPGASRVRGSEDRTRRGATAASDGLRFTGEAAGLQSAINARIGQPAPMDLDRIDAMRASLAHGTYRVNAQAIAYRIVALERQMIG